jgi:hypothetical protein
MAHVTPKAGTFFYCKFSQCDSRGFTTIGAKRRHEKEQHRTDPKCDHCDFTAKRRYQMNEHMEVAHPGEIGNTPDILQTSTILMVLSKIILVTNPARRSRRRASRRSVSSYSSDESTPSPLQAAFERTPTSGNTFLLYTPSSNGTQAHAVVGINHGPTGPAYAANMIPALLNNGSGTTFCLPHRQRPSPTPRCLHTTISLRNPNILPFTMQGGTQFNVCPPIPGNLAPATTNVPNQLNCTFAPNTPSHLGNNEHGTHYTISSYSSPSSDQGTNYSQAAVPRYSGETVQLYRCCYGLPPSQP